MKHIWILFYNDDVAMASTNKETVENAQHWLLYYTRGIKIYMLFTQDI